MKTKVLMLVVMMTMSVVLIAQPADKDLKKPPRERGGEMHLNKGEREPVDGLNLTDTQKESFKQARLAVQKQLQPLHNELGEAEVHQKTLMTAEKPDLSAINKNIEKIGSIKIDMAKIRAKHRLDMRAQLTDEQRLKFDRVKGEMMDGQRPNRMRHFREMHEDHSLN